MKTISVKTSTRSQMIDITGEIQNYITESNVKSGVCTVFVPHTTAAVTINENADPDVIRDVQMFLDEQIPWEHSNFRHSEGNSAAHIKSSVIGSSVNIIIESGRLQLGTWQSVFFCEYDGPRNRKLWIEICSKP